MAYIPLNSYGRWSSRSTPLWPVLVVLAIIAVLVAMAIDFTSGHWEYYHGKITTHLYVPESTREDSDGDKHTDSEEYHLGFASDTQEVFDLSVDMETYHRYPDGAEVWVRARVGKFGSYTPHIVPKPPAEQ